MEEKAEQKGMEQASAQERDMFYNPHDITGVKGMLEAQSKELDRKKVRACMQRQLELKIENELYIRAHPELKTMISLFLKKVLDEQPKNVLQFAGSFFDRPSLKDVVTEAMQAQQ
eukprot:TRINITY_DN1173_c0_g1_i3.p2 TRINITY_DN1173_c0_g1~~TRINITY_DN1173_c0_g1_i3.p2  ORF type:complete len:115 (+),score=43.44 TRINITY_DN1173_c0_g1_i3:116-460(+)